MTHEEFVTHVRGVLSTSLDDLITGSTTGSDSPLRFGEVLAIAQELQSKLQWIDADAIQLLTPARQKDLWGALGPIFNQFERIRSTKRDPRQADVQQKEPVLNFFLQKIHPTNTTHYERLVEKAWPLIVESLVLAHAKAARSSNPLGERTQELNQVIEDSKSIKEQLTKMLSSAQEELSKVGVSKHSAIFEQQAREYERQANWWLSWAIRLAVTNALLVIATFCTILFALESQSDLVRIEVGVLGAVLVSIASFGLVVCVRNYFAVKHNEIVNRHKANCLGTYNTFIDSADPDRKAAVLLQATQTIFSHQKSGYLVKEAEVSSPNPIVEVVRQVPMPGGQHH